MKEQKLTLTDRVLDYIVRFGSISTYDAFIDLGITRLSASIHILRNDGYKITATWVHKLNRYGKLIKFKKYRFAKPDESINKEAIYEQS